MGARSGVNQSSTSLTFTLKVKKECLLLFFLFFFFFNDAHSIFYLRLYGLGQVINDQSDRREETTFFLKQICVTVFNIVWPLENYLSV